MTPAEFIAQFEGFKAEPYLDIGGVCTIGFGSTHGITMEHAPITEDEGLALMQEDIDRAQDAIDSMVDVSLTDEQNTALISFVYNLGAGALRGSTLLRMLNRGDYDGAAKQFLLWNHCHGQVVDGLTRRRKAEMELFNT